VEDCQVSDKEVREHLSLRIRGVGEQGKCFVAVNCEDNRIEALGPPPLERTCT